MLDSDDDLANDGELDVDLAEPTLADRLKSLNVAKRSSATQGEGEDGEASDFDDSEEEDSEEDDDEEVGGGAIPATTLTTTLLQSLHSSDAPLLESCLAHSNPTLIRATVKRLPSGGLVLALLEALVERLGRAKGGKQGTAGVKRSRGLVEWVRQVLVVHVGFLVTVSFALSHRCFRSEANSHLARRSPPSSPACPPCTPRSRPAWRCSPRSSRSTVGSSLS